MGCSVDLVVVVVETSDVAAGELCNLAGRATDTAADIEDFHALLDANGVSQVVLVTGNCLVKGLAVGESAEVERLAPAVLVQIRGQVVVVSRQSGILGRSRLLIWRVRSRGLIQSIALSSKGEPEEIERGKEKKNLQHAPRRSRSRRACCPSA